MESSPNESKEKIKPWEKRREREGSDRKIRERETRLVTPSNNIIKEMNPKRNEQGIEREKKFIEDLTDD